MKKLVVTIALLLMVVLSITATGAKEATPAAPVQEKVMTHDELVAAAQAEGKVVVYSITSRIAGAAVEFEKNMGSRWKLPI